MWLYKDGMWPDMWSWIIPTVAGKIEVWEKTEFNVSQKTALLIDTTLHMLEWSIGLSWESSLKQQQLSLKVKNYITSCSLYLNAVINNNSNEIEACHREVVRNQYNIMQAWKWVKDFESRFEDLSKRIDKSISEARDTEKLS